MADPLFLGKGKKTNPTTTPPPPTVPEPTPNTVSNLLATALITGVVNSTALVAPSGVPLQTIVLANANNWFVSGRDLNIISDDETPLILSFTNNAEAIAAEARFSQIINGGSI